MQANNNNSNLNILEWEKTIRTTKEVKGFITSLKPALESSKIKFDNKTFSLTPANWRGEDSFSGTQDGFFRLIGKAKDLERDAKIIINNYQKPQKQILEWHQSLIEVVQYIDLCARNCLSRLIEDYIKSDELDKATCFQQMGKTVFKIIKKIDKKLSQHFEENISYQKTIDMQRHTYHATPIILRWEENRKHLEEVSWNEKRGVVLPQSLINDCLEDLKEKENMTKGIIRNAANCISIPRKANKIEIILGKSEKTCWIPLHPITDRAGKIEFDSEGVRGTCERGRVDYEDEEGICNVYYFVDPDLVDQKNSQIVISSGVIDTFNKTMQLASCIQRITELNPGCTSKRFVLFQLNSFFSGEGDLILNAHDAASNLEKILKEAEQVPEIKNKISVLHLNVAFNACTDYPGERGKSLKINQEGLLQLSLFVMEDIEKLILVFSPALKTLKETLNSYRSFIDPSITESNDKSPRIKSKGNKNLELKSEEILKEIKLSIQEIRTQRANQDFKPDTGLSKAILLLELLYLNIGSQFQSAEVPKFTRCTEIELLLLLFKLLEINITVICKSGLDRSGSVRSILIALSHLASRFYAQPEIDIEENDFILLLDETAKESLTEENNKFSNQDEIKDQLLVDSVDLLENLPQKDCVLESQQIVSQEDLMQQLKLSSEQLLCAGNENILSLPSISWDQENPEQVRTRIYNKLLQFILRYESNEDQLNQIIDQIITVDREKVNEERVWFGKKKEPYITDLLQPAQMEAPLTEHPRDQVLKTLEDHPHQFLREVLFYQEIIMASLIRESIKTLFSTGVVGVKYHQDANYFTRTFGANSHPMQRLPTFVNLEKDDGTYATIQMKKTNIAWKHMLSWERVLTTEIIIQIVGPLFLRLSQKRGD